MGTDPNYRGEGEQSYFGYWAVTKNVFMLTNFYSQWIAIPHYSKESLQWQCKLIKNALSDVGHC